MSTGSYHMETPTRLAYSVEQRARILSVRCSSSTGNDKLLDDRYLNYREISFIEILKEKNDANKIERVTLKVVMTK